MTDKNEFWQTQYRGSNDDEYQIYLACADNGEGIDITTGLPLKSYEEWKGGYDFRADADRRLDEARDELRREEQE
jgi:hypothetical protein